MKETLGATTLLYPAPVLVVGTYDKRGKLSVMTASFAPDPQAYYGVGELLDKVFSAGKGI